MFALRHSSWAEATVSFSGLQAAQLAHSWEVFQIKLILPLTVQSTYLSHPKSSSGIQRYFL